MGGVQLKYATVQPICSLKEGNTRTFFFLEDDQIGGEYLLEKEFLGDGDYLDSKDIQEK